MVPNSTEAVFYVWGIDQSAYGPIELPTLVSWIKDERVTAETWVFASQSGAWQKAPDLPELQMFFRARPPAAALDGQAAGFEPRMLRRVRILAGMADEQIERLARFLEFERIPQWTVIVRQGENGDSMFLILEGELRVRLNVLDKESILATLNTGEFFGDISLLDHGPRSADVVANTDCLVAKVSAAGFDRLAKEAPEIAAAFLLAVGKTLTARIRADNKRFTDWVKFSRAM